MPKEIKSFSVALDTEESAQEIKTGKGEKIEKSEIKIELIGLLIGPAKALGRICKGAFRAGIDGPAALPDIVGGFTSLILWPITVGPKFIRLLIQMKK